MITRNALHPGETLSPWIDTVEMPTFNQLNQNIEADVCVVGGGLAGLTTAYLLMKEGKKVCLLEDYELGSGQSGRTTAHVTYMLDKRYYQLEKIHGKQGAKLVAQSQLTAIKKIQDIIHDEKIACDLEVVDGYLFVEQGHSTDVLNQELESLREAGIHAVHQEGLAPFKSFTSGPALCIPNQLQLHPMKYMKGLAECIERAGGRIYTHTHVLNVSGGINSATVRTKNDSTVRCDCVVVATHSPINDRVAIHTKQASYRSYVIGVEVSKGTVEKALYWDTSNPYHYVRLQEGLDTDLLMVGGEDHKTGQNNHPQDCFSSLEKWAYEHFPSAIRVVYRWSGQVLEPVDGLAYIGHNPLDYKNVFVITGHSGNGISYSTIGGVLITDLIMNRFNPWEHLYQPSRVKLAAGSSYLKQNTNTLLQYKDWLMENQPNEISKIKSGEGAVFRNGITLIAAYRNEQGVIEMNSAVCPHLGGIVRWNPVEKSWDCPCHGSRFDCHGKVLEGPACKNLKTIETIDTDGNVANLLHTPNTNLSGDGAFLC